MPHEYDCHDQSIKSSERQQAPTRREANKAPPSPPPSPPTPPQPPPYLEIRKPATAAAHMDQILKSNTENTGSELDSQDPKEYMYNRLESYVGLAGRGWEVPMQG